MRTLLPSSASTARKSSRLPPRGRLTVPADPPAASRSLPSYENRLNAFPRVTCDVRLNARACFLLLVSPANSGSIRPFREPFCALSHLPLPAAAPPAVHGAV